MSNSRNYELVFANTGLLRAYSLPRHKRWHATRESAEQEATRVRRVGERRGLPMAAHAAQVYAI